jgi:uncharacterized membrane protein YozB (DUF420 family)
MLTASEHSATAGERRFFAAMAVASLAVVVAGFAASYYAWPITRATHYPAGQPISPSLPAVVHLHALVFSGWVGLLVVQAGLVHRGNVRDHRRLGRAGAGLVVVMVLTGLSTAVRGARDGWNPGGPYKDALSFMFVGIADIAVFSSLTAAGLAWRRHPNVHKRLMVLGTIGGLMWPAITRMPIVAGRLPVMFGLLATLVLAPAVHDFLTRSRARWLSLALGLGVLASFPLRTAIGNSNAWREVALWLLRS